MGIFKMFGNFFDGKKDQKENNESKDKELKTPFTYDELFNMSNETKAKIEKEIEKQKKKYGQEDYIHYVIEREEGGDLFGVLEFYYQIRLSNNNDYGRRWHSRGLVTNKVATNDDQIGLFEPKSGIYYKYYRFPEEKFKHLPLKERLEEGKNYLIKYWDGIFEHYEKDPKLVEKKKKEIRKLIEQSTFTITGFPLVNTNFREFDKLLDYYQTRVEYDYRGNPEKYWRWNFIAKATQKDLEENKNNYYTTKTFFNCVDWVETPKIQDPLGILENLSKPYEERKIKKVTYIEKNKERADSIFNNIEDYALRHKGYIKAELLEDGTFNVIEESEHFKDVKIHIVPTGNSYPTNKKEYHKSWRNNEKKVFVDQTPLYFKTKDEDGNEVWELRDIGRDYYYKIERTGVAVLTKDGDIIHDLYGNPVVEENVIIDEFGRIYETEVTRLGDMIIYFKHNSSYLIHPKPLVKKYWDTTLGYQIKPMDIVINERVKLSQELIDLYYEEYRIGFYPDGVIYRKAYQPKNKLELVQAIIDTVTKQDDEMDIVNEENTRGDDMAIVHTVSNYIYRVKKISYKTVRRTANLNEIDTYYVDDFSYLFAPSKYHTASNLYRPLEPKIRDLKFQFEKNYRLGFHELVGPRDSWNVENGKDFNSMFLGSFFQGDLSKWNVPDNLPDEAYKDMFRGSVFRQEFKTKGGRILHLGLKYGVEFGGFKKKDLEDYQEIGF